MDTDTRSRLRLLASLAASNIVTLASDEDRAEAREFFDSALRDELAAAEANLLTAPALILTTTGYRLTSGQLAARAMAGRQS